MSGEYTQKITPEALHQAILEVVTKARFGGLFYFVGALGTIVATPQLRFAEAIDIWFLVGFVLQMLARETLYQGIIRNSLSLATKLFFLFRVTIALLPLQWSIFALYVLASVDTLAGAPAAMLAVTVGLIAGSTIVLVPHYRTIIYFLIFALLVPAPFLPFVIGGYEGIFLCVLAIMFCVFLINMGKRLSQSYWQQVHLAERLKQQANDLQISQENALAASKAKSDFLAKMSHEIRTPMNGVIGIIQLLDQQKLDQQQKEYIDIIRSSGQALLSIIDDILDFSKLEAGKFHINPTANNVDDIIKEIAAIFYGQALEKGLALNSDLEPLPDKMVMVDPHRLRQVLFNIVGNALKFTEQGHVSITLCYENISEQHCRVVIRTSDSGIGIKPERQDTIFEEFEQEKTDNQHAGTGLGLSISKHLVELMGGTLSLTSVYQQGSTFTLSLPVELVERANYRAAINYDLTGVLSSSDDVRAALGKLNILVVEDNKVNQIVIDQLLQHIGCRCHIIDTGEAVLDTLSKGQYDAIIMDCNLPKMSGFEAAQAVRNWERSNNLGRLPIIALTGDVLDSVKDRCLESGMDDFLIKPATLSAIEKALVKTLSYTKLECQ